MQGRVLVVAGSDSGGAAGIQADIKTITALGAYAMTAITALTAQNSRGVFGVHAVPVDFIARQMQLVLDDYGADVVKTGMLHATEVIETVCATLDGAAAGLPLVADPVMFAKGGDALLDTAAIGALRALLLPRAYLLTPNRREAELLAGRSIDSVDDLRRAAERLLELGPSAVLVKGGHLDGETVSDVLLSGDGEQVFTHTRVVSVHTGGTGCSLASAIASGLAQGLLLADAVRRGLDYVQQAIVSAPGFGGGRGPVDHAHTVQPFGV